MEYVLFVWRIVAYVDAVSVVLYPDMLVVSIVLVAARIALDVTEIEGLFVSIVVRRCA